MFSCNPLYTFFDSYACDPDTEKYTTCEFMLIISFKKKKEKEAKLKSLCTLNELKNFN